jgi:hypothetical protein
MEPHVETEQSITESPAFKQWFRKSRVANSKVNLLVSTVEILASASRLH